MTHNLDRSSAILLILTAQASAKAYVMDDRFIRETIDRMEEIVGSIGGLIEMGVDNELENLRRKAS